MGRVVRSISLTPELDGIVDKNIPEFSEYVQNCIRRDFMTQNQIDEKIKEHEDAIKELNKLKIIPIKIKESEHEKELIVKKIREKREMEKGNEFRRKEYFETPEQEADRILRSKKK
jgi:hypothetical protein